MCLLPCNRTKDKMHAREILLSKHFLSEIKYYLNLYEFLKRRIHALVGKLKNRCFCWFPAAIFVLLKGASIQSFIKLGKTFFRISRISLRRLFGRVKRVSRERASDARSREAYFACSNRIACSQASLAYEVLYRPDSWQRFLYNYLLSFPRF